MLPRAGADSWCVCGIVGVCVRGGGRVSLRDERLMLMRDALAHRGPDGMGLWRSPGGGAVLGHRRLAVVDLSAAGAQPMVTPCGRHAIVYNGELYNDAELRRELEELGCVFHTRSDAETVLLAWAAWGMRALERLRGMYAIGAVDTVDRRLVVARDPSGIKPLVWWEGPTADGRAVVFASEPQAVLLHPDVPARPDLAAVSAYLTTIRLTLGDRTMFEGVRTVRAGEAIEFNLRDGAAPARRHTHWRSGAPRRGSNLKDDGAAARREIAGAVAAHLRSDVPVCALLSGGLDSTIVATEATRWRPVPTYCTGAPAGPGEPDGDLEWAARAADALQTRHTSVPVSRGVFLERWPVMVERLGVPLGTPNEVAIGEVARRLRADGCVVALSGEGADEVFGGYEGPMRAAWAWASAPGATVDTGAADHLDGAAWIRRDVKGALLHPDVWRAVEGDAAMVGEYQRELGACMDECAGAFEVDAEVRWQARLRMLRRVNLAGLLGRLDTATMLEGVEGRTPLADRLVIEAGESLAMDVKWAGRVRRAATGAATEPMGKVVLREAYRGAVPEGVLSRPKASFPLPFQTWLGAEAAEWLSSSRLAGALFQASVVSGVCDALRAGRGVEVWTLAWPMVNVALWGRRWWG
jgi:asparagine synthase (glutamine-hydrolysing)